MAIPNTNGIFIHNGLNCSSAYIPTAQSIPMSPSDSTTVKTTVDNKSDLSIIADEYDTSATYTLGDFVIYDKVLYKCIMHSTTGAWDSTRWVAVNSKDSGINLKNSSGNTLVKIWEDISGNGVISLYDKTTGYDTVSLHGYGYIDAKSITVMTSGQSNSGRIELTTTQSNSGYISLRDDNKNTPIDLNADDGNINAVSLNGVTIGSSPKFTDTTYESKNASSGGIDLSLVTTGEKYIWNNKSDLQLGTTSTTALKGDTKYAGSSTAGGSATSAAKLDTATAGSATQPCYFANGVPSACTYSLNKTVPADAKFTDYNVLQQHTATNAEYRILLSGTATVDIETTNVCKNSYLKYNPSTQTLTTTNISATKVNGYTLGAACAYSATTSVASGGGALVTSGGVYTAVAAKQNKITRTATSRYFTSKTSMAYTGLSLTCPANHIYLVQAWFRYANGAPRYVGACHSSTTYAFYDCVAASTDAGTTNAGHASLSFILTPGETIYYWAMYYNATQNFISESVVDITIS